MRTIDSSISVLKPSNIAWWHTSWTGRFILAALLIAAVAFVLTPGRTSAQAQGLVPGDVCKSVEDDGMLDNFYFDPTGDTDSNSDLVNDCIALITAGNSLDDTNDLVVWIVDEGQTLTQNISRWSEVTLAPNFSNDARITAVDLSSLELTGSLADEWADLTALTTLNLSDNGLSGTVPRDVWNHLHELAAGELNVSGNPDLSPAPALNLMAVVTKEDGGTTEVALSWDDIGWYTSNENAAADDAVTRHIFKYRHSTDGETWDGYIEVAVGTSAAKRKRHS